MIKNMKRHCIYALFIGLFVSACNDIELPMQSGVETETTDIFIPEDAHLALRPCQD